MLMLLPPGDRLFSICHQHAKSVLEARISLIIERFSNASTVALASLAPVPCQIRDSWSYACRYSAASIRSVARLQWLHVPARTLSGGGIGVPPSDSPGVRINCPTTQSKLAPQSGQRSPCAKTKSTRFQCNDQIVANRADTHVSIRKASGSKAATIGVRIVSAEREYFRAAFADVTPPLTQPYERSASATHPAARGT